MHRSIVALIALLALVLASVGCTTDPYTGQVKLSKTAIGALLGAGAGAGVGALADRKHARGALIGAGVGVLAGGAVGGYMDMQEAKLRERLAGTGVGVTRAGNEILLNMPGNITFESDRADIRPTFFDVLGSVALVLGKYQKTIIEVLGHTDSTGSTAYNQSLSERRAASVGQYLIHQGIDSRRVVTQGFGEAHPLADNATAEGRQLNRRVELRLVPLTG